MKADLHLSDYKNINNNTMTIQRRQLALRPVEITNEQLMKILSTLKTNMTAMGTNMAADMLIVQEQIGTVEDTLLNMNSRIGVLATSSTETITAIDSLSRAPLISPTNTMANVSQSAFNAPSEFSKKASNNVYAHIRNLMWDPKLKTRNQADILANESKPRWNTNVFFYKSPNKELVVRLLENLKRKFTHEGFREADLRTRLHKNFTSRVSKARKTEEEIKATNTRSRRAGRARDNHTRRLLAYTDNKEVIDLQMKRYCDFTMQMAAMFDGESADEDFENRTKSIFNTLIKLVEEYVIEAMGSSASQMKERVFTSVSNTAVPDDITPKFSQWALRDGY
ncbi:hypothetical protein PHYBLDRAFT_168477 [Phycomyces blakesleeanus NRRL 1555(-)]|uniref:Uncharacterized protein n=1 Tax=Phycomyces blakesleeanus (strain ATCC 8743b / DSM 1359 / FGSC 10004 / NBRC 33097 / NRRL 1555) TaxID=763407 RepID=A0A162U7F5_PHYB8|nr:hypothetical protein PHYBLDRAFT_175158 [Phycomyces blakesleeanus NRRL 1555(-)]XP_018292102.1 hypothetical protein PHYBLDRAFT_73567 [Phycomyces blakesleeanus NRRL 1555(-)]XP_018292110.1 hypothetical protein PHYBLDRAFT_168477 [Phycomyces blakesleeanus NRRL 1555(-)]OAD66613.1 hypothetical protein PHYBLDRAFT_175158 [Phycomyces blakesleeanus NRRL 1555(-)]OAD74062.1 hypothetical protein PHYBLDRAFT_73567 [Phycomyces blakesleeanus NRRL 1555(-)]OAD74070.1 hypothetical protein PHYBLDRAFT_168477 [Phyc|eukprot:XP_018284653.1 hypothetical protein PHYBLDRAFT_175158 [Phycomyces blakesleeanus NRRL 1555(-)]